MKNEAQNIPADVFDWMEKYSFSELSAEQKEVVRPHLTEAEYQDMHLAVFALRSVRPRGKEKIREELLDVFDNRAGATITRSFQFGLGKVAALVVFFVSLMAAQYVYFRNQIPAVTERLRVDTFIVEATTPAPVLIRDTVFIQEKGERKNRNAFIPSNRTNNVEPQNIDLYIARPSELALPYNQPKQNSLQQDSLIGKYGFVSM